MVNLANMTPEAIEAWNRLSESWGQPINVISTYRDPATNTRVGGAKGSQHLHGNAFDISTAGMTPEQIDALIKAGAKAGFRGFGGYNNSLHFDVGPARTWGPDYGSGSTPAYLKNALAGVEFSQAVPTVSTKGGQAVEPDQIKKDAMAQSTGVMGMAGAQPSGMMGQRTPIKERFRDPDFWNELALTFHSMSSFPNEAAIRSLESRVSTSRERRREQDQLNKTIAFFEKSNMPQLAELARVSPTAAINAYGQMIKPTSTSAASPLGKLVEDYKRGLITKEQLDAAIAKANAQSPGLGVSIGKDGTVQITQGGAGGQTNKLVQQVNAAQELLAGIERYRSAFKEAGGPKLMPGTAKTRLDAAKTSLMMQLKDVFELGAITGPDMQILEGLVINATDPANYALDALGISSFADRFEANMTELEQQIQGALARNYRRLGIQSPTNPAPPKAGQSNGAQSTSGGSSRFSVEN